MAFKKRLPKKAPHKSLGKGKGRKKLDAKMAFGKKVTKRRLK